MPCYENARHIKFLWESPLNLLYLDPDVKYIPTEGKAHAWDKLKGSEKAGQESEMDDADIMAANIEEESIAVASKILAAMQKQAPGLELVERDGQAIFACLLDEFRSFNIA